MSTAFPLFPPSASSVATEMDLLYLFIAAVCAFFVVLVAALVVFFADQVPPAAPRRRRRRHPRLARARADLDVHPVRAVDGDVRLGRVAVLPARRGRPPTRWTSTSSASSGCGRCSIPRACARSTSCTCRSAGNVRITLGSEDVIHDFSHPGVPREDGRRPGQADDDVVQGDAVPGTYHIFCAQYCGTKHSGMIGQVIVDGRRRTTRRGSPAAGRRARRSQNGEQLFTDLACITCHKADSTGRGPSLHRRVRQHGAARPTAARSSPTTTTCASRS